jgi:hypothetical protein
MRRATVVAALIAVVGSGLAFAPGAKALGTGTFTRITSPASPIYLNDAVTHPTITIAGVASPDLSLVDVYCYSMNDSLRSGALNTSPIAVIGGHFGAVINGAFVAQGCRLRAIPDGTTPSYVASYAGPVLLPYLAVKNILNGVVVGGTDDVAQLDASLLSVGVDQGGVVDPAPVDPLTRVGSPGVLVVAGEININNADSTASSLIVDGHFAYTPDFVMASLAADGVTYTPPAVKARLTHAAKSGDDTLTLTLPLVRCSGANSVTPTSTTCPKVTALGVDLVQTSTTGADGRQVTVHLSLVSTDGKRHSVSLQLIQVTMAPPTGQLGYLLPNGARKFAAISSPPRTIAHLPAGVQSILVKRDIYAADGDPNSSLGAVTISGRPASTRFYGNTVWVWNLHRTVAPHLSAGFSYVTSVGLRLAEVKALARAAAASLTGHLAITTPKPGVTAHSHQVSVTVLARTSGNGLPVTVTIDGKTAKLLHQTATTVTYRAVITLSAGAHDVTADAIDSGGVREVAKRTITVG